MGPGTAKNRSNPVMGGNVAQGQKTAVSCNLFLEGNFNTYNELEKYLNVMSRGNAIPLYKS